MLFAVQEEATRRPSTYLIMALSTAMPLPKSTTWPSVIRVTGMSANLATDCKLERSIGAGFLDAFFTLLV